MISNATRVFCAMLSTMGATGLVVFADPANAVGASRPVAPAAQVATLPAGIAARG